MSLYVCQRLSCFEIKKLSFDKSVFCGMTGQILWSLILVFPPQSEMVSVQKQIIEDNLGEFKVNNFENQFPSHGYTAFLLCLVGFPQVMFGFKKRQMYIAVDFLLVIFPAILKPWLCQKFYVRIPAKLLFCLVILPCFLPSHVPVPNCPTACPSIDLTTCLPRVGPCPETNQVQSCGEYPGHPDP